MHRLEGKLKNASSFDNDRRSNRCVGDKDVVLRVPLQFHPTTLLLPILNARGALCGRPENSVGIQGISSHELNDLEKHSDGRKFTTPALDTALFCQFLAKNGAWIRRHELSASTAFIRFCQTSS